MEALEVVVAEIVQAEFLVVQEFLVKATLVALVFTVAHTEAEAAVVLLR
jgi:hypothetical protein